MPWIRDQVCPVTAQTNGRECLLRPAKPQAHIHTISTGLNAGYYGAPSQAQSPYPPNMQSPYGYPSQPPQMSGYPQQPSFQQHQQPPYGQYPPPQGQQQGYYPPQGPPPGQYGGPQMVSIPRDEWTNNKTNLQSSHHRNMAVHHNPPTAHPHMAALQRCQILPPPATISPASLPST